MINTTIVRLLDLDCEVYTTLEGENPGGSIKDHMVMGALLELIKNNSLNGKILTEASAGSTALSLAHYCELLKIPLTLFIPDNSSLELQKTLASKNAKLKLVPLDKGLEIYQEFCHESDVVPFNQHYDESKKMYYRQLGKLVEEKIGTIDVVIGAIGTSHSLVGFCEGIKTKPRLIATAEPCDKAVLGIRNYDHGTYGAKDPFKSTYVDQRLIIKEIDFFNNNFIESSMGKIEFPDSFRIVLGALKKLNSIQQYKKIFLVGASNKRAS